MVNPVYFSIFIISLVATLLILPLIIKFCLQRGILDFPNHRKLHAQPTPRLGGIAIYFGCLLAWAAAYLLQPDSFSGVKELSLWLLLGSVIIFLLGLWDDLQPIRFRYKILV